MGRVRRPRLVVEAAASLARAPERGEGREFQSWPFSPLERRSTRISGRPLSPPAGGEFLGVGRRRASEGRLCFDRKEARKRKEKRPRSHFFFSPFLFLTLCLPSCPLIFPLLPVLARHGCRAELRASARGGRRVEGATFQGAEMRLRRRVPTPTNCFFFLPFFFLLQLSSFLPLANRLFSAITNHKTGSVAPGRAPSGTRGGSSSIRGRERSSGKHRRLVVQKSPPRKHLDGKAPPLLLRVRPARLLPVGAGFRHLSRQGREPQRRRIGECGRALALHFDSVLCSSCCCFCRHERREQRTRRGRRRGIRHRRWHLQGHQRRREPGGTAPGQSL